MILIALTFTGAVALSLFLQKSRLVRELVTEREAAAGLRLELEREKAISEQKEAAAREKLLLLENLKTEFKDTFQLFAHQAVDSLAARHEKHDIKKEETFQKQVEFVQKSIENLKRELGDLEKERKTDRGSLEKQIEMMLDMEKELKKETQNLTKALQKPKVRGMWGEMQLKRILEISGMLPFSDFTEQQSFRHEEKLFQPDVIVHLPNDNDIIIDSKAPITAFLEACQSEVEEVREGKLIEHVRHLKGHIDALSKKAYHEKWEKALDFVILFLPSEVFLSSALESDAHVLEYSAQKGVILATPTVLLTLLKTAALGWRERHVAASMHKIRELALEMGKRVGDFVEHVESVGKYLKQSVQAYNRALGSYEKRVLVSARKLHECTQENEPIELEPIGE